MTTVMTGRVTMPKTSVVSSRLSEAQRRVSCEKRSIWGGRPSETGALLIEEGLRRDEFAFIERKGTHAPLQTQPGRAAEGSERQG